MDNKAMFKIGYGLYILTAKDGEKDNGCVINTAIQVTSTPNRISVTVNKQNYTHDMIMKTGVFNVSILSEKATFDVFKHFGFQSGRDVDKFADYKDATRSENGLYYVTGDTNAYISGKVINTLDLGTHTMFIADVTDAEVLADVPTTSYDYYQKNIKPKPEAPKKVTGYVCKICGYIYEGDPLPEDFICPICKHGAADFEKIEK
ncbi:MAG: flavin reductase [Anaerostipes sp.]|uniref:flavin reductase n=1 Tax=Anaerostipes sp. 992a TaxID=1261637 RepID=UPI000951C5DF|nr:flavin reductase [Anaerostipes sp. 992a]MCI5952047.1 flavin reductase [Anaerostipes sp.]MDD5969391.1 flavin reductase [Anaerostipes sp.]OLR63148.1 flavin reductase [Anaerostipes sp. 992a]